MAARRADVFCLLLLFIFIYTCFCIRKSCFCQPDGISITITGLCKEQEETFVYSSLFAVRSKSIARYRKRSLICLLLLACGDVERCPGPQYEQIKSFTNMKGIKFLHQNIRGIFHNMANLTALLSYENRIDILTLSETHIEAQNGCDNNDLYTIPGYNFISRCREIGKGGGVATYISEQLTWKRREDLEVNDIECIWLEIFPKNAKSFLICCMYRPPDSSLYLNSRFNEILREMLIAVNKLTLETIIMGDVNVNYLKQGDHREIKDIFKLQSFVQLVKKPTRITQDTETLIDVIFTNKSSTISHTDVLPLSLSDHDCIGCVRKVNHQKFKSRTTRCRNYNKYDPEKLNTDINNHDWQPMYEMSSVESSWEYFKTTVHAIIDKHAPVITKMVKGRSCPWLSAEIKKHMNNRDKLLRKARKTKKASNWLENRHNPRKFWKTIKSIFPAGKSSSPTNSDQPDAAEKLLYANKFCRYFSDCARKLKDVAFPLRNLIWRYTPIISTRTDKLFHFHYVTKVFVEKELKKSLKRKKATGADDIPPGVLKDAATLLSQPLAFIINLSLRTSTIPSDWKIAKVTPLFKGGNSSEETNYRPISVLPIVSKILERAVHHQLIDYLESNNLLSRNQFGYRRKRSTEMATTLLTDNIRKEVDSGNLVGAIFVDLSKAFDTLSHGLLLSKLCSYGIKGIALNWFSDYLFNRKQYCVVNNVASEEKSIVCGVPQGSILGPILFLLYFNDFEECVKYSEVIEFADDTVLYFASKRLQDIEDKFNYDLEKIAEYLKDNELVINLRKGKTESMVFGTQKRLSMYSRQMNLYYNDVPISSTTHYKYLGTVLDPSLNMNENFNTIYKRASNKLRLLSSLKMGLTADAVRKIYTAIILPGLSYCSNVQLKFSDTQIKRLESIDNRARILTQQNTTSL
ncbi:uncharacterized protein LOC130630077 [Hydractinia symbiolongicarpus]|uniref:uncharacterized protein LOC130630077 n=1 Tax=Hydractinia symbiolongicarpus TaxID=13093 RepID=UPI00254FB090|nr:uncharacterized protein LOC130630077 [Hydractinia symbiolongicarpus]